MGIEKEFPENYFRNERHKSLANILFTSSWIVQQMKLILEGEDLTPQQYNILRILQSSNRSLSMARLRELMLDKMSDISRIVERLVKKDLVTKEGRKEDKRQVDVSISKKGLLLLDSLHDKYELTDSMMNNLSKNELNELNNLLDTIREKPLESMN